MVDISWLKVLGMIIVSALAVVGLITCILFIGIHILDRRMRKGNKKK